MFLSFLIGILEIAQSRFVTLVSLDRYYRMEDLPFVLIHSDLHFIEFTAHDDEVNAEILFDAPLPADKENYTRHVVTRWWLQNALSNFSAGTGRLKLF